MFIIVIALVIKYNNFMSCVNIKEQFLSYVNFHPHQSSFWNAPTFMKSCNEALCEVETLKLKVAQFDTLISKNRLRNKQEQQSKMLHNLKQNIKICQNHLKRIQIMQPDMKCSSDKFLKDYKSSIVATLEMKMLAIGIKFKQIYQKNRKSQYKNNSKNQQQNKSSSSKGGDQSSSPNLKRSLFIQQSQQQLMQEVAVNQYRQIQKSITKISIMYKQTAQMVRMHDYMIDSIESDINQTEVHVEGGKRHLTDAHRRQSKNRPFIIKVFIMLYIVSGIYIIVLS